MKKFVKKIFLLVFFILIFSDLCYSKTESEAKPIPIKIPITKKENAFLSVDKNIISLLENGSVESLMEVVFKLRKSSGRYSDNERVVLYITRLIVKLVWTYKSLTDFPEIDVSNLKGNFYICVSDFAADGIFDKSNNRKDFLSYVLPALSVTVKNVSEDYFLDIELSLKKALELEPNSVLANYLLGILYEKEERYVEACSVFSKIAVFENIDSSVCQNILENLANCYKKSGNYEKAIEISKNVLKLNPIRNEELLKICALSSFEMKDFVEAENYINKVLQQEPKNLQYIFLKIKTLIEKKEYIRASSILNTCEESASESKDYLFLNIKIQRNWKKKKSSILFFLSKALELYPNDFDILLEAATFAFENNNELFGKSSEFYADKVLDIDSENIVAKKVKINNFMSKKNWESAYKISSLLASDFTDSDLLFSHIEICLSLKKNNEAWKLISEFYDENSTDENFIQLYIKVLIAMSKTREARNMINGLLDNSSSKMKSFLYYQKSLIDTRFDDILSDLRLSLTSNPRNENSLFRLYSIYYEKKEYKKAQFYLKQVVSILPNDMYYQKLNTNLDSLIKESRL